MRCGLWRHVERVSSRSGADASMEFEPRAGILKAEDEHAPQADQHVNPRAVARAARREIEEGADAELEEAAPAVQRHPQPVRLWEEGAAKPNIPRPHDGKKESAAGDGSTAPEMRDAQASILESNVLRLQETVEGQWSGLVAAWHKPPHRPLLLSETRLAWGGLRESRLNAEFCWHPRAPGTRRGIHGEQLLCAAERMQRRAVLAEPRFG